MPIVLSNKKTLFNQTDSTKKFMNSSNVSTLAPIFFLVAIYKITIRMAAALHIQASRLR